MTATNHALTGAIIGLSIHQPGIAMIAAFLSHFILDALPHFSFANPHERSPRFIRLLVVDTFFCGLIVLVLISVLPSYWLLASICAFLATSPDFMWAPDFFRSLRGGRENHQSNMIKTFHSQIQWFARPSGAAVEFIWASGAIVLLAKLLTI